MDSVQFSAWLFVGGSVLFLAAALCDDYTFMSSMCPYVAAVKPISTGSVLYLMGSLIMARDAHAVPAVPAEDAREKKD